MYLLIPTVDEQWGGVACWRQAKRGDGMARLWKGFSSYTLIGGVNTLIHWQLFYVFSTALDFSQAVSNFLAFCVAVSFSFYVNATCTFAMSASLARYLAFVACMGALSLGVGWLADRWGVPGIVTVMVFSVVSLVCGFLLSRWVVFRERGQ